MKQSRKFSLQNSQGDVFDLNTPDFFAYNPEGLGIQIANSYSTDGVNFQLLSETLQQNKITLPLLFGGTQEGNPYERYDALLQFLDWPPLKLLYTIPEMGTFTRDVRLAGLTKSEMNLFSVIDETLTLDCLTPWYVWVESNLTRYDDQEGDGLIFKNVDMARNMGFYIHPYVYQEQKNDGVPSEVSIENRSRHLGLSEGSALEVSISPTKGHIRNPHWTLKNKGSVQSDGYFVNVIPGETLRVSSDPTREFARIERVDGQITNIYKYQDIMRSNFVRVPKGTSQLSFTAQVPEATWGPPTLSTIAQYAEVKIRIKRELVVI